MKYYHYISRSKIDMLLPQVTGHERSIKLSPKIGFAGVSLGADVERRRDTTTVGELEKLLKHLDSDGAIRDLRAGRLAHDGTLFRAMARWHHGLFYFKGGVPTFWGRGTREEVLVVTAIYAAWMICGDSLYLLVGSPNNVLGDRVAPEGIFMPGTGGVEEAVRQLVQSLRTDEPSPEVRERQHYGGEEPMLEGVRTGSTHEYTGEYGHENIPLPGFRSQYYSLSLAQFCLKHLARLPAVRLETVFRVFSTHSAIHANLSLDLGSLAEKEVAESRSTGGRSDYLAFVERQWQEEKDWARRNKLEAISRVYLCSPIYTALAAG